MKIAKWLLLAALAAPLAPVAQAQIKRVEMRVEGMT